MRTHGAILFGAFIALLAAMPAHSQENSDGLSREVGPFRIEAALDAGLILAAGDAEARFETVFGDLDLSLTAEAITDSGVRWGLRTRLRAQSDNGREGFAARSGVCLDTGPASDCHAATPQRRSLATGHYSSVFLSDTDRAAASVEEAHVYLRTGWGEVRAGMTPGAARLDQPVAPSASRLITVGGGAIDPTGLEAALTQSTASGIGPKLLFRSERILGLSAALSFTGQSQGCGVDVCIHETDTGRLPDGAPVRLQGNALNQVWEAGLTFDHQFPNAGRVELGASVLTGEVDRDPADDAYTAWTLAARWTRGDWSVGGAWLNAGQHGDQAYTATSAGISYDRGDWRFAGEAAWSSDDFLHEDSALWQLGASRLVGDHLLLGGGVRTVTAQQSAQGISGRSVNEIRATTLFFELGARY